MYVAQFQIQPIPKKSIEKEIKSSIKLFIPPIVLIAVRNLKKMING